jgi:transcriptional regulator with XRE-family HTH domain
MPTAKENSPIRHILNPPPGDLPTDAPAGYARAEFAKRIQQLMARKGWSQADLARESSKHLPRGVEMGRDSVSYYVRGKAFPSAPRINALARALGVKPEDLVPTRGVKTAGDPSLEMRTMADGRVWLRVNKEVDPSVAAKVVMLLSRGE